MSLGNDYPVKPGEALQIIVTESVNQNYELEVSVTSTGKPIPFFYAAGLLQAAAMGLISEATANGCAWLGVEDENP